MDWALRSGIYCARGLIEKEDAPRALSFNLDVGEVTVEGTIRDESAKLCVNALIDDQGEIDPVIGSALTFLLSEQLGAEKAKPVMEQIRDWMDPDSAGAYESDVPNRRFLLLEELAQLPGLDAQTLHGESEDALSNFITIWSDGKVNVNTAPHPVLRALFPHVDQDTLAALIDHRQRSPLHDMSQLKDLIGTPPGATPQKITFSSLVFTADLVARADSALKKAQGVLQITNNEEKRVNIIMWRQWWPRD